MIIIVNVVAVLLYSVKIEEITESSMLVPRVKETCIGLAAAALIAAAALMAVALVLVTEVPIPALL
jgi:hypothetical protein